MKKSFITFVFCLFTISFTLNCKASATDSLNQLLINLHSLTAHFTQTIIDGKGNILQQTSGQMALQRPGKFRWETQAPTRQLLVADGNHVWFYDADLKQVTVQNQQSLSAGSPALLLSGAAQSLLKDFAVSNLPSSNANTQSFRLTPREKSNLFQTIQLSFQQKQLSMMRLTDKLGQVTQVKFMQVQNNPILSNKLFHFIAPKGVDVVTE